MTAKVAISTEFLVAMFACVWLDVCMSEEMGFEVGSLIECASTLKAFMR